MVVVKIEMWPHGDESKAYGLGVVHIANDGTGDTGKGNYDIEVKHGGIFFEKPGNWKTGRVTGFIRTISTYH